MSGAHLKNLADSVAKMMTADFTGKKMANFDVKTIFTNMLVDGALESVAKVLQNLRDEELSVRKTDYKN